MSFSTLFAVFIVFGYSVIYPALAAQPDLVVGILPSAGTPVEILAKRAQFGSRAKVLEGTLVRPPGYDFFLCERFRTNFDVDENGQLNIVTLPPYQKPAEGNSTVMLVPRGECSFERKAYAAKHFYGAKGILIYDRLGARYTWNENTNSVGFPQAILDYECGNGVSMMYDLPLDPPAYNEAQLDPLMGLKTKMPRKPTSMATTSDEELSKEGSSLGPRVGLCDLENTARNPCESQLCVVTSHVENSTEYPVCCAWDTPVTMPYADDATDLNTDDILAVWLTIRQSELLLGSSLLSSGAEVSIKKRGSRSAFNITYIFMWIWATLVMMVGAWYSAGDYRRFKAKLTAYKKGEDKKQTNDRDDGNRRARRKKSGQPSEHPNSESLNSLPKAERRTYSNGRKSDLESGRRSYQVEMDGNIVDKSAQPANMKQQNLKQKNNEVWSLRSLPPPERKRKQKRPRRKKSEQSDNNPDTDTPNNEEEVGNQSSIIPARESGTITPFELNQWHVVAFVVIMSSQLILLYFVPQANTIFFIFYGLACAGAASYLILDPLINTTIPKLGSCWVEEFNKPVICGCNGFNVTSYLITYTWVGVWIWYGITHYRPETNAFFWITLNILGACLCILVISVLKLTSIKIATMLMVAIFLYDIFFVFITPFLTGGVSVMLKVATGSGNPNGEDFCYKYPDDRFCKGIGFLPMLFIFPKANDYANGSVILGLGDILLPGFLIAFSARHDEAARLLDAHAYFPDIKSPTKWYEGYFPPMLAAYSFGLFSAYLVVIVLEQGQPALLYICPVCLGAIFILGRKEIKDLWNGSKVLKLADGLMAKTERKWGKARMKEFANKLKQENTDRVSATENEIGQEQHATGRSTKRAPIESSSSNPVEPRSKDVCFGYEDHPGTKAFRKAVEEVANDLGEEEYKPEIYKIIKQKLKGRRFFMTSNIVWAEASKLETRKQIGRAYDRARGRRSTVLKGSDPLSKASIS